MPTPLHTCPFCDSGSAWTRCSCRWAVEAQANGMMLTRQRFQVFGGRLRPTIELYEIIPSPAPKPVIPAPANKIKKPKKVNWLRNGKAIPRASKKSQKANKPKKRGRPKGSKNKKGLRAKALARKLNPPKIGRPSTALAPEGQCKWCDRRRKMDRARINAYLKRRKQRREQEARNAGRGGTVDRDPGGSGRSNIPLNRGAAELRGEDD